MISPEHTGKLKPSISFYEKLLEETGFHPDEIIMVGDSIKRDLIPAKLLGLKTAIAKYGQTEAEEGIVDYELETIDDIVKIV